MSKQSDAKAAQGYQAKPVQNTCLQCAHFSMDRSKRKGYFGGTYVDDKNLRCNLGGFAVGKMATCNQFLSKIDVG